MDPLGALRVVLLSEGGSLRITIHNQDGHEVGSEINKCVYIKLGDGLIYARDTLTNFRSKRGTGDFYPLDAVWFLLTRHRESSYGEYMQEARKFGVTVVSLVDRKDLTAYMDDESATSPFVDLSAAPNPPMKSFSAMNTSTTDFESIEPKETIKRKDSDEFKLAITRDTVFLAEKSFARVLEVGKRELQRHDTNIKIEPRADSSTGRSLIDQITIANQPESTSRVESSKSSLSKSVVPIIIIPASPSSIISMVNAPRFLGPDCTFETVMEAKQRGVRKENIILIEHRFGETILKVQLTDNPTRLTLEEWSRVVGVFVQGQTWQFKGWRWELPPDLFQQVCGFYMHYTDQKITGEVLDWKVTRLPISKSRRHLDSTAALKFWSTVESLMRSRRLID